MTDQQPVWGDDDFASLLEDSAEDLYEHAPCGYFSTLPDGTIAKVNATFLGWTGYAREDLVGKRRFQSLLAVGDRIFYETHYEPLLRMQREVREIAVEIMCVDGTVLPVLINTTVRTDAAGHIAYFRTTVFDARQRRAYERELLHARRRAEESETQARELARTLQESFVPPTPSAIPGFDVGVAFRPAGTGDEVGGDFYDVFPAADGEWVVVLGDVRGKGVLAARVTALARYTVRTAAMQTREPAAVLSTLNEALRRSGEERFCTVAYVRIRTDGTTARVTVTSAGHALPLLVSAAEDVVPVGVHGDLVGVLPAPEFAEVDVAVGAGDVICLFTDGVTEGRRGDEYYGDERLIAVLRANAEQDAGVIAESVVDEVVAFQDGVPRDDIAVVVLRRPSTADEG